MTLVHVNNIRHSYAVLEAVKSVPINMCEAFKSSCCCFELPVVLIYIYLEGFIGFTSANYFRICKHTMHLLKSLGSTPGRALISSGST